MTSPFKLKNAGTVAVLTVVALMLASCNGFMLESEKAEGKRVRDAEESVQNAKLPTLSEHSEAEDYILYALLNNPSVKAAFIEWKAAVQSVAAARSLPDPRLEFQADITNTVMSVMPGFMAEYTLPEKREALGEYAVAQARTAYFEYRKTALEKSAQVLGAWADYAYYKELVELMNRQTAALAKSRQYSQSQYETNPSATLDAQLAADLAFKDADILKDNAAEGLAFSVAQFKAALGVPRSAPAPAMPAHYPDFDEENFSADTLWDEALKNNPDLKILRSTVETATANARVAESSELPDFEIGLEADVKASPVMYRPKAKMTLPIWRDKIESVINSAKSMKDAAALKTDSAEIELAARIALAQYTISQSQRTAKYIKTYALPQIDASIAASNAGYESGMGDLTKSAELETLRAVYGVRMAEAERDMRKATAELKFLILGALPSNAEFLEYKTTEEQK